MSKRHPGLRRHGRRWQAYVRVRGQLYTKTFPLDTPVSTMLQWRLAQGARVAPRGTLADDIATYLLTVRHMPSYTERAYHLAQWASALGGHRSRHTITTAEIDAQLSAWLTEGKAPGTVKHYRTALVSLYRRLDGDGPNPAARSHRPQASPRVPRFIPPETIAAILDALPDRGRGEKDKSRPTVSQTKARLWLLATTGIPHKQIGLLTPAHVHGEHLSVPGRQKGHGAPGRTLALTPAIRYAIELMADAGAWGPFSTSSMRHSFRRALKALGLPLTWTPYDLRHSIGALVYADTKDLATVARLLGHADPRTTAIYAAYANADVDRGALERAGAKIRR